MGFVIIFASIVLTLAAIGIRFQRGFIYQCGGDAVVPYDPTSFGLPTPSVRFQHPRMYFARNGAVRTVFFVAGNGASVQNSYWHLGRLYGVCNCNLVAIEKGCSSQQDMVSTVRDVIYTTIFRVGRIDHQTHQYYLMGVSLGSAVVMHAYDAMDAYERARITGIILDNPFTTLQEVVNHHVHQYFLHVPAWLILDVWDNRAIQLDDTAVLFLTAERDEIVPPHMSWELMRHTTNPRRGVRQVVLSGSLHGHAAAHPDYLPAIKAFFELKQIHE